MEGGKLRREFSKLPLEVQDLAQIGDLGGKSVFSFMDSGAGECRRKEGGSTDSRQIGRGSSEFWRGSRGNRRPIRIMVLSGFLLKIGGVPGIQGLIAEPPGKDRVSKAGWLSRGRRIRGKGRID